jgi:hypothetical protein
MAERDKDGERLLDMDEVAIVCGWKRVTVRHHASAGRRAARGRPGQKRGPTDFPAHTRKVYREYTKANGQRGGTYTPLWRYDVILGYLERRGLPAHPAPCAACGCGGFTEDGLCKGCTVASFGEAS